MRIVAVVVAAGVLLGAAGAVAQDGADGVNPFGALIDALGEDPVGPWTTELTGGTYTIANTEDPDAYRIFMTPVGKSVGQRHVVAEVEIVEGDAYSHAGILVAYRDDPLLFYLWALEPGGWVTLWRLDGESADYLTATQSDAIIEGGVNRLAVQEASDQLSLYVNDTLVGLIGGLDGMGGGQFGVAVWGTGRYVFHSYEETMASPERLQ